MKQCEKKGLGFLSSIRNIVIKIIFISSLNEVILNITHHAVKLLLKPPYTKTQIGATINSIFDLESAKPKNSLKCICGETKAKQREKVAESTVP